MPKSIGRFGFDGTTGRSDYGGRRTHIIQLLRDTRKPLSVSEVADAVGIHINTARFHLESLVDAGLAQRSAQPRSTPGRPRVLYVGTLPNQTHERAQGFRLLAETLTQTVCASVPDPHRTMYTVGVEWGRKLAEFTADIPESEEDRIALLLSKLEALWFAPELVSKGASTLGAFREDGPELTSEVTAALDSAGSAVVFHHCPFVSVTADATSAVCSLHAGLMNGLLDEMGSTQRTLAIHPWLGEHQCLAPLVSSSKDGTDVLPVVVAPN